MARHNPLKNRTFSGNPRHNESIRAFPTQLLLVFAIVFTITNTPLAQSPSSPPTFDPKATAILKQFSESWKHLNTFKVEAEFVQSSLEKPANNEPPIHLTLAAQRPGRLFFELKMTEPLFTVVSDGQQLYSVLPYLKQHVVDVAPATLDQIVQGQNISKFMNMPPVIALLAKDPYDAIIHQMQGIQLAHTEKNDGRTLHHIKCQHPEYNLDLVLKNADNPFTLQQVTQDIIESEIPSDSSGPIRKPLFRMSWQFKNWAVNTPLPPETFAITPDTTTRRVRFIGESAPHDHPLLGKTAPLLELTQLDGSTMNLADYRNKNVVVLDFWASWCVPCQRALPVIDYIARDYRDRNQNVVFYAVNLGEPREKIEPLWKNAGFSLPVLLDSDQQAGNRFGISGIPHTVVIGTDGTIQSIHVGLLPTLELTLTGEIDYLLSGKKLIDNEKHERDAWDEARSPNAK